MHDKQVRRRRAVLALLVAVSLILLTAYFGESPTSPLHSVQRGVVEVLSPIEQGASKALKPVRDVAGWFSDTLHAKSQVKQLQTPGQNLTAELAQAKGAQLENAQLSKLVGLDNSIGITSYHPVAAHVIARDPTLWYATIEVDKGSDDGVQPARPGDRRRGAGRQDLDVSADRLDRHADHRPHLLGHRAGTDDNGDTGVLVPAVGNPNQLLLQYLPPNPARSRTALSGPAGRDRRLQVRPLESLFPAGIPIGQVPSANENNLLNNGQVQVTPAADLRHLDVVQILTSPQPGTERAQVP